MKNKNDQGLKHIFSSNPSDISPILDMILTFCLAHRDAINEELNSLKGESVGKWVLDLTTTCLTSVLSEWGQKI